VSLERVFMYGEHREHAVTRMSSRAFTGDRKLLRAALLVLALAVVATGAVVPTAVGAATASRSAPEVKDPAATARRLVIGWLTALQEQDAAEIADSLAPNFQIERADGSGTDRAGYLEKPAVVTDFTLGDEVTALQSGNTLTARWSVKVSEQINENEYRDVEAPRLTTFVWHKGRWKILSYANFNPIL
jgi:hypothetical protein